MHWSKRIELHYVRKIENETKFFFPLSFCSMAMLMPMCIIISCRFDIAHSKFIAWNRNILSSWTTSKQNAKKESSAAFHLHWLQQRYSIEIKLFHFIPSFSYFSLLDKKLNSFCFSHFLFNISTNRISVNIPIFFPFELNLFVIFCRMFFFYRCERTRKKKQTGLCMELLKILRLTFDMQFGFDVATSHQYRFHL